MYKIEKEVPYYKGQVVILFLNIKLINVTGTGEIHFHFLWFYSTPPTHFTDRKINKQQH